MSYIDLILTEYESAMQSDSKVESNRRKTEKVVPASNSHQALRTLRIDLPKLFENAIFAEKGSANGYSTKGSCGQLNFNFAKVPWVAVFNNAITKGASNGYYIVLLFSEERNTAYLTLNQGFTAFLTLYGSSSLATQKIQDCANAATQLLTEAVPAGFVSGPINLSASVDLGKGYQAACILSKQYRLNDGHTNLDITNDFVALLKTYDQLVSLLSGTPITSLEITVDEAAFQAAANEPQQGKQKALLPPGGLPLPPMGQSAGHKKYLRSPAVTARVITNANGVCAFTTASDPHMSFTCGKRHVNYIEGHHLIPFSQQYRFAFSIDVDENIIPLCPNCHRLLHHAKMSERKKLLSQLLPMRANGLAERLIPVTLNELIGMYGKLTIDD